MEFLMEWGSERGGKEECGSVRGMMTIKRNATTGIGEVEWKFWSDNKFAIDAALLAPTMLKVA